ncbi:MAG: sigma-54-dependent Fis family transcriptional regulator [Fibrobacteres bacterium]|nr:sigma-54-dependent Fis family transcriptional regulator [Fibrobacterota bacterium]
MTPNSTFLSERYAFIRPFVRSRYAAFVIDSAGNILEKLNPLGHLFDNTINEIQMVAIQESFKLPKFISLNEFFSAPPYVWLSCGLDEIALEKLNVMDFGFQKFPSFPYKPNYELKLFDQNYFSILPLINLILMKLNSEQFLGIVTFHSLLDQNSSLNAIIDTDGQVVHYGRPFTRFLDSTHPESALNKPLDTILHFEEPLLALSKAVITPEFKITFTQNELLYCSVPDGHSPRYFHLPVALDFTECSFRITLHFHSDKEIVPSIGLNVMPPHPVRSADSESLSIFSLNTKTIVVKTREAEMAYFYHPVLEAKKSHSMVIERISRRFRIVLNGQQIGEFFFDWESEGSSSTGMALFVRQKEDYYIDQLFIETAPSVKTGRIVICRTENQGFCKYYKIKAKPLLIGEKNTIQCTFENVTDLKENINALSQIAREKNALQGLSSSMHRIHSQIKRIASTKISVLLEGETGCGKEVLAREIHKASDRKEKPFIKIDCAALPESLMETELFGHEKGAFTGATERHLGRFEQAQGGTVFLDEVANLTLSIQAKLLTVLQDLRIQRIGGNRAIPLDIRIIIATNISLRSLVKEKVFREDLYYRLNQFSIEVPPLRDRMEDLPLYAQEFMYETALQNGKEITGIEPGALKQLMLYKWPGNIRELRNVIQRAVLIADGNRIREQDLLLESELLLAKSGSIKKRTKGLSHAAIKALIADAKGNLRQAAETAGIHRATLYRWMEKHGIAPSSFRD